MRKIDLITGFLGAGKTTLLIKYVRQLLADGIKTAVVVNDHGAVNVDMVLLRQALGSSVGLEMVLGDGDPGCHKRRLRAKLIALAMESWERVVVEPSGVFEAEEFFDILHEEPLDRFYELGSVMAVIDSRPMAESAASARYLLAEQVKDAGAVVMSKSQLASLKERRQAVAAVNSALSQFRCGRVLRYGEVLHKSWDKLTRGDLRRLREAGRQFWDMERPALGEDYMTFTYLNTGLRAEKLLAWAPEIFSRPEIYGSVTRIKGSVRRGDGQWQQLNLTAGEQTSEETALGQDCIIVIGRQLDRQALDGLLGRSLK